MSNRKDFYFRQKVTEAELDSAFNDLEVADRALITDLGLIGVAAGMAVSQQVSPNMTVQVSGPGAVYDQTGQRIYIPSTQSVNCALDEAGLNTAVVTPGNSRVLSLFAKFRRSLSDPRVDGNGATVYFEVTESYQFNVAKGTEGVSPVAPVLRSDQILLADITIAYGATTIVNANISTTRREWMFRSPSGTSGVGTAEEAIQGVSSSVSDHLTDPTAAHAASAVSFTPGGGVAATNVQTAIAELDSEKLALAGGTMTGPINMGGEDLYNAGNVGGADFVYDTPPSRSVMVPIIAAPEGGAWAVGSSGSPLSVWEVSSGAADILVAELLHAVPHGATVTGLDVFLSRSADTGTDAEYRLFYDTFDATTPALTSQTEIGTAVSVASGTGVIKLSKTFSLVVDKTSPTAAISRFTARIRAQVDGRTKLLAIRMHFTDPGPRNV